MDIRKPIGLLFTLLGFLLAVWGLVGGEAAAKARTIRDDVNINLWWGIVMLLFGLAMLALARVAAKRGKA
ncbi:MAG: hypothetical protein LBD14_05405 [Puniceicoccales bacterium]|jgi:hypothetical protein|nr:hypothetical protein [Puniceicoccales bacterium]